MIQAKLNRPLHIFLKLSLCMPTPGMVGMVVDSHECYSPLIPARPFVTAGQLVHNVIQRKLSLLQQHQQVIDEVADFKP